MINKIIKKQDIPNTENFEFYAVMADGTIFEDKVYKTNLGLHKTTHFTNMIGWIKK